MRTKKILLIPDVHAPYHHRKSWGCMLTVVRDGDFDVVVVLGDFNSFDAVSRYPIDPRHVFPLEKEVEYANVALDELDVALKTGGVPRKQRYFTEGNHEVRLDRYVLERAPELRPFIDWRDMLHMDRRGWQVTRYNDALKMGELEITHTIGRTGPGAARQSLLDLGHNIAFGDTHRLSVHYQGQVSGKRHVGATLGWLGDPECIGYKHKLLARRDWQHGFGVVHMLPDGTFWLQAIPIVDGKCVVDGEVYGA